MATQAAKPQPIVNEKHDIVIADPPLAVFLFSNTRMAWFWLILRVYLGWQWVNAGWGKFNNPAWMDGGTALKGFWTNPVTRILLIIALANVGAMIGVPIAGAWIAARSV